jgi:hypothetical protein
LNDIGNFCKEPKFRSGKSDAGAQPLEAIQLGGYVLHFFGGFSKFIPTEFQEIF